MAKMDGGVNSWKRKIRSALLMLNITIVLHSLTFILGLYLFALFIWWWIKLRVATIIYKYTTGLMFGIFAQHLGATIMYLRYAEKYHDVDIPDFDFWIIRHFFMLMPLIAYAVHSTKKIYHEYEARKQIIYDLERRTKRRRTNDKNGMIR
jgi:hypothetical protein